MQMYKRILAVIGALIVLIFAVILFSGKRVDLKFARPAAAIGGATTMAVEADAEHGVKNFSAAVEQNGQTQTVYEDKTRSPQRARIYTFTAGQKQATFLKEGPAKLILKAKSNDLRGSTTTLTQDIQVVLRPPTVVPDGR